MRLGAKKGNKERTKRVKEDSPLQKGLAELRSPDSGAESSGGPSQSSGDLPGSSGELPQGIVRPATTIGRVSRAINNEFELKGIKDSWTFVPDRRRFFEDDNLLRILEDIPSSNWGEVANLLEQARVAPGTIGELDEIVSALNRTYAKLAQNVEDVEKSQRINDWKETIKAELYETRDELLRNDPGAVRQLGAVAQYNRVAERVAPEARRRILEQLERFEGDHGVALFGITPRNTGKGTYFLKNDCNDFAGRLYSERYSQNLKNYIETNGILELDSFPASELQKLAESAEVVGLKKVLLRYKPDPTFPFPYHAKTALIVDGDYHVSLEAHTGKPFLLAPEIVVAGNEDAFLEQGDIFIVARTSQVGVDDVLSQVTSSLAEIDQAAKEQHENLIKQAFGVPILEPIGRSGLVRQYNGSEERGALIEAGVLRPDHQAEITAKLQELGYPPMSEMASDYENYERFEALLDAWSVGERKKVFQPNPIEIDAFRDWARREAL